MKKYKEADVNRTMLARKASQEFKRLASLATTPKLLAAVEKAKNQSRNKPVIATKPSVNPAKRGSRPKSRQDILNWFDETQWIPRNSTGEILPWFHGMIGKKATDELLLTHNDGDFLVRLSERVFGYVLSVKYKNALKHFIIDASKPAKYQFIGMDQISHVDLESLIDFHKNEPLSLTNLCLQQPIGQANKLKPDYGELRDSDDTQF